MERDQVIEVVDQVIKLMQKNRMSHGRSWRKIRIDRLNKIIPTGIDQNSFMELFLKDVRISQVDKCITDEDGNDIHVPAVKVHLDIY